MITILHIYPWIPNLTYWTYTVTGDPTSLTTADRLTWQCPQSSRWTEPPPHHTLCRSSSWCHTHLWAHHRDSSCQLQHNTTQHKNMTTILCLSLYAFLHRICPSTIIVRLCVHLWCLCVYSLLLIRKKSQLTGLLRYDRRFVEKCVHPGWLSMWYHSCVCFIMKWGMCLKPYHWSQQWAGGRRWAGALWSGSAGRAPLCCCSSVLLGLLSQTL